MIRTPRLISELAILIAMALIAVTVFTPTSWLANPATDELTLSCDTQPSHTPNTVQQSGVQGAVPGETVEIASTLFLDAGTVYQDILSRPDGSTYYATYLELVTLDSDLVIVPDSVAVGTAPGTSADPIADAAALTVLAGTSPHPTSFVLETDTTAVPGETVWRLLFPGDETTMLADQTGTGAPSYTVPADGQFFVLSYIASMPSSGTWGEVHPAGECFASVSSGPSNIDTDRPRTSVSVVKPELIVTKDTPAANVYIAGAIASYTLTARVPELDQATQTLAVAPSRDTQLVDTVPPKLIPLDAAGAPIADGGTTGGGGTWDLGTRTVTYDLGDLLPGATVSIAEDMQIDPTASPTDELQNDLTGIISYLPGAPANDTVIDPADEDSAVVMVASNNPTVEKVADFDAYGTGLPFEYTVTVQLPAGATYENFTIFDELPDGMTFLSYVSAVCTYADTTACASPAAIPTLTATAFPGGGWGIGWYPDNVALDAQARTIAVTYEVQLEDEYSTGEPVVFFDEFENGLEVLWNTVDRLGSIPPSTASMPNYDGDVDTSDAVVYDRPILEIDKIVETSDGVMADRNRAQWDYEVGDIATYTSTITNVGSSDAQNLTVTDTPVGLDVDVSTVLIDAVPCGAACSWDGTTLTMNLTPPTFGPIAANGGTMTVSYEAEPTKNGNIDNLIAVPSYDDPIGTAYTEGPSDAVPLEIPDPVLTLSKNPASGVVSTGVSNAIGTRFPFTFTITNTSATTAYNVTVIDIPPLADGAPEEICNVDGGLITATGITETAAGEWALDSPLAPGAVFTFDAEVEVCGPIEPDLYVNVAELRWEDLADDVNEAGVTYFDEDTAPLQLVGPEFEVFKSPVVDGGVIIPMTFDQDENTTIDFPSDYNGTDWVITVTNTGTVPIGGLVVNDPMPATIELDPTGVTVQWIPASAADTFVNNTIADDSGELISGYADELDLTLGQLQPGASAIITVPFLHNAVVPDDLDRPNTATVTNPNITFDPDLHQADGEITLVPPEPGPSIDKTVGDLGDYPGLDVPYQLGPGGEADYTLDITIPVQPSLQTFDHWVYDQLPDGLSLVDEPIAPATLPAAGGWTMTCLQNCEFLLDEADMQYLGSAAAAGSKTDLAWHIGDIDSDLTEDPLDPTANDIVVRITFRVVVDKLLSDGREVIDGVADPMVNLARPVFNREADTGDSDDETAMPAGVPPLGDYDRVYPKDTAEIDIVTPRLDLDKTAFNSDGDTVTQIDAGQSYNYEISVVNGGSGTAYDVDFEDDLGAPFFLPFFDYVAGTFAMTVDGNPVTIDVGAIDNDGVADDDGDGYGCDLITFSAQAEHLFCEIDILAPGSEIVITYDATTVDSDEFHAQFSTQNFDPMFVANEVGGGGATDGTPPVNPLQYFEAPGEDPATRYTLGQARTRLFAYTPVPEVDFWCVGGADVIPEAPIGAEVQIGGVVGNGDRYDVNGNADGDRTLTPYPTMDLDGDGFPDVATGYSPTLRITLQDKYEFLGITATGPGMGDPSYTTYSAFPAYTALLDEYDGVGTYTLEWTNLPDIPHSPFHATQSDFQAFYDILIDVKKLEAGGASFTFELTLEDAAGNTDRGNGAINEPFEFREYQRNGCPGGPVPQVWKYPDVEDAVTVKPGEKEYFRIYIEAPDELNPGDFVDTLPDGLIYAGDPAIIGDPTYGSLYEVATIESAQGVDPWPTQTLEDFFVSALPQTNGDTVVTWSPPPLPAGFRAAYTDSGLDERWILTIPVLSRTDVPYPNDFVINSFKWATPNGDYQDTGAVNTEGGGQPSLDKRLLGQRAGTYGGQFEFEVVVTIPAGFSGNDVFVYDQINRYSNWDTTSGTYAFQELGRFNLNSAIFSAQASGNYRYDPAEIRLVDYQTGLAPGGSPQGDTCDVSCGSDNTDPDWIDAIPMTPNDWDHFDPVDGLNVPGDVSNPLDSSEEPYSNDHGQIGWFLGDIEPDANGGDRVLTLRYTVQAPTLTEQRQRIIDRRAAGTFPLGVDDPQFNDPAENWFNALSEVNHPNYVELRTFSSDTAEFAEWQAAQLVADDDAWETGTTQWVGFFTGSSRLAQDDSYITVGYPRVDMDKSCRAKGATDDTQPIPTGGQNVDCEITVTNNSPLDAYDVTVTDTPLDRDNDPATGDCVWTGSLYNGEKYYLTNLTSSNIRPPEYNGTGTGRRDPADPDVVGYECEIDLIFHPDPTYLDTGQTQLPATWTFDLAPGEVKTFEYSFQIDGWSNLGSHTQWNNTSWTVRGEYVNEAVLSPWSDADEDGQTIGLEIRDTDGVAFQPSYLHVSKFPFPADRDISDDARPFANWLGSDAEATNLWPYYYAPGTPNENLTNDQGDPFGGDPTKTDYWYRDTDPANYVGWDLLEPVHRRVDRYNHIVNVRGFPLGYYANSNRTGWRSTGFNAIDVATNDLGYFHTPLNDPDSWAPAFDVEPNQPYTWAIDLRVDGLRTLDTITIEDSLPHGWSYVPNSAVIIDGNWELGSSQATWANETTAGFGIVPLADPATITPDTFVCDTPSAYTSTYHGFGEQLTWNFRRDGGLQGDAPWVSQYVNGGDLISLQTPRELSDGREFTDWGRNDHDKYHWIRIQYDAIPDPAILSCDPDSTSTETWFMENNVEASALRSYDLTEISDTYEMLAPVPNPVALDKTPDDDFVADDTLTEFTITFTNDLDVAVEDITFTDILGSSPVAPLADGGYDCGTATASGTISTAVDLGFVETSCVGGLGSQNTTLEWTFDAIAPGEVITITMPMIIPKDETNLLVWDNEVSTTVKEYYDAPLSDEGKITVVNPSPPQIPTKSSTPNPATINDIVEYTVSWDAEPFQVFMDLAYIDTIPDGLDFIGYGDVTCSGNCPAFDPDDVIELTPVPGANPGETVLMWWFGDMPGSAGGATWEMTYQVRVRDTYANGDLVLDEDVLTNTVTGYSNEENLLDDPAVIPDPSIWTTYPPSDPVTHDLDIEEPELAITKSAAPAVDPAGPGSVITFTVEVENVGGMPAYAVELLDTPNGALENITMNATTYAGSVVTRGWTAIDPVVGWFIPVLGTGDTATFTYDAVVTADFLSDGIPAAENLAAVDTFRARPGLEPEPGDRFYSGPEDSVEVPLAGPELVIDKFVGGCADEFQFVPAGTPTTWCIVVENTGGGTAHFPSIRDTLPVGWTYDVNSTSYAYTIDATTASGAAAEPAVATPFTGVQQLDWTLPVDLAPDEQVELTFTATPGPDAPLNVTNWASVTSRQADNAALPPSVTGARDNDPATAAMGAYALEISKTPDEQQHPHLPAGGPVTWTITVSNPADSTTNTNLVVTDFLPAPLEYNTSSSTDLGVSAGADGTVGAGAGGTQEVTWTIDQLDPGESIEILITADAQGTETENQWYVNDVQVVSDQVVDVVANQAKVRFYEPASLGDFVWEDTDADGQQDGGEPGIDGVTVNLLDADGNQLYQDPATGMISTDNTLGWPPMSVTTGDDPSTPGTETGWYEFDDLPAGNYIVEFVPPAGYGPTVDDTGDDTTDSDANPITGQSHVVSLDAGEHDPTIDGGFVDIATSAAMLADLDIEKSTNLVDADLEPGPALPVDSDITWTYVVTNTGHTAIVDATVTDDQGVTVVCDLDGDGTLDGTNIIPLMLPGDEVTCEGTGTSTAGQYENNANVEGDPVTPDPDLCDCDLNDPTTWPDDVDDYEEATDANGDPLPAEEADDPSHTFGVEGGIDIEKDTNGFDADIGPGPSIATGADVTWTYEVTNTSTTALLDATVTDDQGVVVDCDVDDDDTFDGTNIIPILIPGASRTCQGTGTATAGAYENLAEVVGTPVLPDPATCGCDLDNPATWPEDDADDYDPAVAPAIDPDTGDPVIDPDTGLAETTPLADVEAEDPSHYFGTEGGIDIEKDTNGADADVGPGPGIPTGDAIIWTYEVTNTSTTAIVDATVTDDQGVLVDCDVDDDGDLDGTNIIPLMLPGDVVTCEGTGISEAGPYENLGSVTGTAVVPDPATCDCDLDDPTTWPDDVDDYDPAQEAVIDPDTGDPVIDPDTGEPELADLDPLTDEDPSHYFGDTPALEIEKATNGLDADTAPGPAILMGGDVTWTYEVTNTSTAAIADATVTDDQGVIVDCDVDGDGTFDGTNIIPLMLPGDVVTCEGTGTAVVGQYVNVATVIGDAVVPTPATCGCDLDDPTTWPDDPDEYELLLDPETDEPVGVLTATDPSHHYAVEPTVSLEKATNGVDADTRPGLSIQVGDPVIWTYVVTNTSNVALIDATVTDDQGVTVVCDVDGDGTLDGTNIIPLMLPGDAVECQGSGTAVLGEYTNVGSVVGTPALPDPDTCGCDPGDPTTWPDDPELFEPAETVATDSDTGEVLIDLDTGLPGMLPLPDVDDDDPSNYTGVVVDLAISKVAVPGSITHRSVSWQVDVTNVGPDAVDGPIIVTDNLPAGLSYSGSSGDGWSCTAIGAAVECRNDAALAAGATAPSLIIETQIAPGTERVENLATVGSGTLTDISDDIDTSNNTSGQTVVVPDRPGIPITGSNIRLPLQLAVLFVTLGGALFLFGNRRRRPAAQPS